MANTPVCPYCNYSPEARIAHLREKKKK
jgi:hypothetical protein